MNAMKYQWEKPEPFFIEFGETYLHGDLLPGEAVKLPELLFLHGAQGPGRREFLLLRQVLWDHYAISSCAFDFIGYGTTGGKLAPIQSQTREIQARDIINACFDLQAFSIVATDISRETAVSLAECFQVRHIIQLGATHSELLLPKPPFKLVEVSLKPEQSLTALNNNPATLAKVATLINTTLRKH